MVTISARLGVNWQVLVCLSEHGDGGPYSINEIDLQKDAKVGEVYENADSKEIIKLLPYKTYIALEDLMEYLMTLKDFSMIQDIKM